MTAAERARLQAEARKIDQELVGFYQQGKPLEALDRAKQALAMRQKLYPLQQFPQGHPDLAASLINMGDVLRSLVRLEPALKHYQKALAMYQKLYPAKQFPQGDAELARSLNNMGVILESLGRPQAALEHYRQALAMCQKLYPLKQFPDGHANLATSLDNMGGVLRSLSRLEPALELYQQALAMRQKLYPLKQFPQGHTELARSLNNMGGVLELLGRLEPALEHHQQALTMCQKLYPLKQFPQGHAALVTSLINMGDVLESLGRPQPAQEHYQQALAMSRKLYPLKQFPQGHPDLAGSLNGMGFVLQSQGRLELALEHFQEALAMYRKLYPRGEADLAMSLNNMGSILQALGRLEAAQEHFQQALAMYQKLYPLKQFPQGHTYLAGSLNNIGYVLLASRQYEPAVAHLEQALVMQARLTGNVALAVSEGEALAFARASHSSLHGYLSATLHLPQSAAQAYARVWTDRAALSRILHQRHQAALAAAADKPEVRDCFARLQTVRRDLAYVLLQPLPSDQQTLQGRDRLVNELTQDKRRLERELVRLLADLDKQRQLDALGPADLQKALPAHSAFVDLLRYRRFAFDPKKPSGEKESWTSCYVAFVVCPEGPVQRVELEEARPIEEALADWRHLIEQRKEHDSPEAANKLRRRVWDKIADHLPKDTQTVFLAPDADLTRLPWHALPGSKPGSILLEDHALAIVPHGPFLLEQLRSERRFGQGQGLPLVLGGVSYSEAPEPVAEAVAVRGPNREGAAVTWIPLKGSERELRLLQQLYGDKTVALQGRAAGVPRLFRELPQARLAHFATHGFFNEKEFRREQQRARQQATDVLRGQGFAMDQLGKRITVGASNPLSYTGLVLAGANEPAKAGPYGGILTGEAILDLDLRKLELAVLSACQTGLGDVANGECVHNLQHAFHVAGCPNVVASLWSVPDEATAALMGLFYRELHDGKPPLEALRAAQLYLYRHPGQIKDLAERAPLVAKGAKLLEPEPTPKPQPTDRQRAAVKDWAAFVLSGVGK